MTPAISTIIVNYNAGSLLRSCVAYLLACPQAIEIIIVDNASSDGSLNGLDDISQVTIVRNSTNLGFAVACNIGIKASTAPYLLFLNPDCDLVGDALAPLLNDLQRNDQVGMVGGLLLNWDCTEQAGGRRAVPTPWRSFVRAFGLHRLADRWPNMFYDFHLHKQPLPAESLEVEAISGACMLVKRKAIYDVGLWDEGYFLHCEDLDWCMRFRQKGWKILFVPASRISHALGACSRSRRIFVEWHKHKGMLRFYRKFFSRDYPAVIMWLVTAGVWIRFVMVTASIKVRSLFTKNG
jgi:GT2 family glycosyltransferase